MADGALNTFTEEFDKTKAKLIEGIKSQEKSVPAVAGRVVDALSLVKSSIRRIPNYRKRF
jgi:hypothetical protein